MKNLLGLLYKFKVVLALVFLVSGLFSMAALSYETMVLHYPDRDWKLISYEKKAEEDEVVAKFIPRYDDKNNWVEMLIFHSYHAAKKSSEKADSYIDNLLSEERNTFGNFKSERIKSESEDAVSVWCQPKGTAKNPAQCEILRVTVGAESLISIQYINRDVANFPNRLKVWLPIVQNAVAYYSYFRWNPVMNKAICVEL